MGVSHWETLRGSLLPSMELMAPGLLSHYDDFVKAEGLPDFYAFQETELCSALAAASGCGIADKLGDKNMTHLAYSNWRTAMEECYAVGYFERFGCRVIQPSLNLVDMMLDTEVNWELGMIRAPWPHVYFELPKGHSIVTKSFKTGVLTPLEGFYVSWSRVTDATRRAEKDVGGEGFKRCYDMTVFAKTEDGRELLNGAKDADYAPKAEDAFGDWACRVMAVQRDSHKGHDWSVHFFNLHWEENCTEVAEGHLARFRKLWDRSPDTIGRANINMGLYERLFHLAANIFLYMSHPGKHDVMWMPDELRERLRLRKEKRLSSKQRRKLKRRVMEERRVESWVVGRKVVVDPAIDPVDNATGISRRQSLDQPVDVRGYWRGQWYGSAKDGTREKKPIWIEPHKRGIGTVPRGTKYVIKG
jgi:hypothetical protein